MSLSTTERTLNPQRRGTYQHVTNQGTEKRTAQNAHQIPLRNATECAKKSPKAAGPKSPLRALLNAAKCPQIHYDSKQNPGRGWIYRPRVTETANLLLPKFCKDLERMQRGLGEGASASVRSEEEESWGQKRDYKAGA